MATKIKLMRLGKADDPGIECRPERPGIGRAVGVATDRAIDRAVIHAAAATDATQHVFRIGVGGATYTLKARDEGHAVAAKEALAQARAMLERADAASESMRPKQLAALNPLHPEIEGFSITAGNSSGLNDGSAAMVIVDSDFAHAHGLQPMAVIKSWASAGLPPKDTGLGPTYAIPKALDRAGMSVGDVDVFEIN